jgi:flagellar biogenesis protein FliO
VNPPRPRLAHIFCLVAVTVLFPRSAVSFAATDAASPPASIDPHIGQPIHRDGVPVTPSAKSSTDPRPMLDLDSGHIALALASVIGLILLLRYVGNRFFPAMIVAGRGQTVRILARCPLAPRQQVVLIQIGRRIVVAGDCGSQLTSLCQITDADEVASLLGEIQREKSTPISTPFTSWFKSAAHAFGAHDDETSDDSNEKADLTGDNVDISSDDPSPLAARAELEGLSEKVRDLARQLGANK